MTRRHKILSIGTLAVIFFCGALAGTFAPAPEKKTTTPSDARYAPATTVTDERIS